MSLNADTFFPLEGVVYKRSCEHPITTSPFLLPCILLPADEGGRVFACMDSRRVASLTKQAPASLSVSATSCTSNGARAMHVFLRKKQNQRLCVLLKLKQHEQLTLVSHNLCFSIYLSCHLGTKVTK
jgi:hypothetical protein